MLWAISNGSRTDMDAWSRLDVIDFFRGLKVHNDRIKNALKKNRHGDH